jgi:glutathione peroxidase
MASDRTVPAEIHTIDVRTIDGRVTSLGVFRGQVLLIVNVASRCGYTPQYEALEALYRRYRDRGFAVLGFPCNQFGRQEPGTEAQIASFCSINYDVTFPLFAKVDVNGDHAHPLFRLLKAAQPGFLGWSSIKWNFAKFLVGRDGRVIGRYASADSPASIASAIEAALAESPVI